MALVFPALHFLDKLLQTGRKSGFWPHALLQPFTHGIADVTAGLPINLIGIVLGLGHCHGSSLGVSLGEFHLGASSILAMTSRDPEFGFRAALLSP